MLDCNGASEIVSYRFFQLPLEVLCMIIAVHLNNVKNFLVQNYTNRTLGHLLLGRTLAAKSKRTAWTDVTVTHNKAAHLVFF